MDHRKGVRNLILMSMDNYLQAVELVDKLESFFKENAAPFPNESAIQRIQLLCSRISSYDSYIAEKCGSIEGFARIFFSDRKHKAYKGGADNVYEFILSDLTRIRQRLMTIHGRQSESDHRLGQY